MALALRVLWTLLLGLALAGSPMGVSASPTGKPSLCKHCHCGGAGCCVDEAPASPAPAPTAPLPSPEPGHDLAFLFTALPSVLLPQLDPLDVEAALLPSPHFPAVALHARHCCFLI